MDDEVLPCDGNAHAWKIELPDEDGVIHAHATCCDATATLVNGVWEKDDK